MEMITKLCALLFLFEFVASDRGICGLHPKNATRVLGGQVVDPDEWPWMAAILGKKFKQLCGGILISNRHVLSAARCFSGKMPKDVTVRLGEYDFEKVKNDRDFEVEEIFVHEQYLPTSNANDIALLKLKKEVEYSKSIKWICMPQADIPLEGKSAYVTGWGASIEGGNKSDVLLEVQVPIWRTSDCSRAFRKLGVQINENQICAGYDTGKDSCQGDMGGPLVFQMADDRWVLIGIASYGKGCTQTGVPGVYARVSSYWDWIRSIVRSSI